MLGNDDARSVLDMPDRHYDGRRPIARGDGPGLIIGVILSWLAAICIVASLFAFLAITKGHAHDYGRFTDSAPALRSWFNGLRSGKGLCCSFADGVSLSDVDWDAQGSHYRVRIAGQWIVVPDDAVLVEPNRLGVAVVWPYKGLSGETLIRCFIAGAGI